MLKLYLLIVCLLNSSTLISEDNKLPEVMDFGSYPTMEACYTVNPEIWSLGYYAFNLAPEIMPIFARLKKDYQIDTAVETGTYQGYTTVALSFLFDQVHTIEINPYLYSTSKDMLKQYTKVECHLGSSEIILNQLLPSLRNQRVLFYLDAHWHSFWPLLDELHEISKTHQDNCIIVIDDFKVPNRNDIPYDFYESHGCTLEYIEAQLNSLFTSYTIHYVIPKSVKSRAKFIAIPTKWVSPSTQ